MKYHESYFRTPFQKIGDVYDREHREEDEVLTISDLKKSAEQIGSGIVRKYFERDYHLKYAETINNKTIVAYLQLKRGKLMIEVSVYTGEVQTTQYGGGYGASGLISESRKMIGTIPYIDTCDISAAANMVREIRKIISK